MSNSAFTPTVLTISSGTGSGSGEKNYITNPSMSSATTGWNVVGDFTLSRTTAASDLPREYSTATGIKIVATNAVQSTADYIYFDFNLDDVDLGKKLKIQWSQKKIGTYSAGQLAVVITTQADRTTALITPQTTAIPASDLDFITTFDSTTTAALSLVIRATADMTTGDGICISDVVVGPGDVVSGAAISEWVKTTATITSSGGGAVSTGTGGSPHAVASYQRIGSSMRCIFTWRFGTTNASFGTGTIYRLTIPGGFSINSGTILSDSVGSILGVGRLLDNSAGTFYDVAISTPSTSNTTYVTMTPLDGTNTDIGPTIPFTFAADDMIMAEFTIPIAEWASNGTVSLGAGAQVEYAYSTDTTTTAGNTQADNGLYGYGPSGTAIVSIASSTLASFTSKRVRFQYPIQTDDLILVEINQGGTSDPWVPIDQQGLAANFQARARYGIQWQRISGSTTDILVQFGNAGATAASSVTQVYEANNIDPWSGYTSYKWRVRKAKASSPVGFGLAGTDGSAGLYKPGAAPGQPNNSTIASGYIGQKVSLSSKTLTGGSGSWSAASTSMGQLTAGVWLITILGEPAPASTCNHARWQIRDSNGGTSSGNGLLIGGLSYAANANAANASRINNTEYALVSSTIDIYAYAYGEDATVSIDIAGFAVRIA